MRLGLVFAWMIFAAVGRADSLDQWTWRNPLPTGDNIYSVVYGNGRFVALGGNIMSSLDGRQWETSQAPPLSIGSLAYGNGQFVAFTDDGSSATSVDGINWANHPAQDQFWANALAYGNQLYVAVGYGVTGSALATSVDGITWTVRSLTNAIVPRAIAYGSGQYVAVGYEGLVMQSSDGSNWIQQQLGTKTSLYSIMYGGGQFVALGDGGTVLTSVDGIAWTSHSFGYQEGLRGVGYGNGLYVAVGGFPAAVFISRDATTWNRQLSGPLHNLWGAAYGDGAFVVMGESGTIFTSTDGINWASQSSGPRDFFDAVFYGGGRYVLLGHSATDWSVMMMVSTNGANWVQVQQESLQQVAPNAIAYGNQQFVAVGSGIATSTDGLNWTVRNSPGNYYPGVCYGGGLFVATSDTGAIVTSPDGISWTAHQLGTTNLLSGIAYGNGQFVAVGSAGVIATSRDAVSWAQQKSGTQYDFGRPVYGNGRFVALAGVDRTSTGVVTSTDGTNWSVLYYLPKLNSLTFGNGQFVAVGDDCCGFSNPILTSNDGQNWVTRAIVQHYLEGVCYGDGHFLAVGEEGTIVESGDIITLAIHPQAGDDSLSLSLAGPSGRTYAVQNSTDLVTWNTVTNVPKMEKEDLLFPVQRSRSERTFYRAYSK